MKLSAKLFKSVVILTPLVLWWQLNLNSGPKSFEVLTNLEGGNQGDLLATFGEKIGDPRRQESFTIRGPSFSLKGGKKTPPGGNSKRGRSAVAQRVQVLMAFGGKKRVVQYLL